MTLYPDGVARLLPMQSTLRYLPLMVLLSSHAAWGQTPSVADLIEKRAAAPPPTGTRQLAVGTEQGAPVPFPSVTKLRDGRFMMVGSGKVAYSSDAGQTWSGPVQLPVAVDYVITLRSGIIGGPVPEKPA